MPDAALIGRYAKPLDALHAFWNFAPEPAATLREAGLDEGRMPYFAARSAPMGAVSPTVAAAAFYNFNPDYIAEFIPRSWELASPEAIVAARLAGVDAAMRRILPAAVLNSPELAETAELLARPARAARPDGRPLFAGHAAQDWPDAPHLRLWHAMTLLREHRGDCHTAALIVAGLSGIEALITHVATGNGFVADAARSLRGWSSSQWDDALARLRDRDLLDVDGVLTDTGAETRRIVEDLTDDLAGEPWDCLDDSEFDRLVTLVHPIWRTLVAQFPRRLFGPEWSVENWPATD